MVLLLYRIYHVGDGGAGAGGDGDGDDGCAFGTSGVLVVLATYATVAVAAAAAVAVSVSMLRSDVTADIHHCSSESYFVSPRYHSHCNHIEGCHRFHPSSVPKALFGSVVSSAMPCVVLLSSWVPGCSVPGRTGGVAHDSGRVVERSRGGSWLRPVQAVCYPGDGVAIRSKSGQLKPSGVERREFVFFASTY